VSTPRGERRKGEEADNELFAFGFLIRAAAAASAEKREERGRHG